MAGMIAALASDGARDSHEAVRCHCGQLLARRYGSVIVPIGARYWREKDGRQRLECPSCKARVTVEKVAA